MAILRRLERLRFAPWPLVQGSTFTREQGVKEM
jgi:hypothetical protein